MAVPTIPIEIWAVDDVILPNTHELNKSRPIDDLWSKGWDLGQKPTAEEFNYVLNMLSAWAKYISGEQIPGLDSRFLRISQNLADLSNKATARTNLEVYSKTESDTRFVNVSGDTMTGALTVPRLNLQPASTDIAYITTTNPAADWTYFDFVLGDNPGTAGQSGVDTMRFRFQPSGGGGVFNMMELNAISSTAALCRITGNLIVSGSVTGSSVTGTNGTFTNASVTNTLTVNTLQSNTTRATNVVATNNVSCSTLTVSSTATVANLNVSNNNATVGGRNIVRRVNGASANAAGDLTLTIPSPGVTDVRLGSETLYNPGGNEISWTFRCPTGCMLTGIIVQDVGHNSADNIGGVYYRPVQKFLNGSWLTVGSL